MCIDRISRLLIVVSLLPILLCGAALAHKVNVFTYVEGDSVHTESYFNDGRKCKNSTITVSDAAGEQLLEGKTDEEGLFVFPIPKREDLKIVLTASMGHRAEYLLSRREFGGGEGGDDEHGADVVENAAVNPVAVPAAGEVAHEVDRVLDRRIAPLVEAVRRLEKNQQRASLRDVIGGIGYIVGLAGLYYYLRSRRSA